MESSAALPLRERLLQAAREKIEESGPEALRARSLTAQVGTSTQSLYTLFGGMPGLIDALVADAFEEFARFVEEVEETDDPVADFFAKGWAYSEWALCHPQLYRLMFGLSGGGLRRHVGLEVQLADSLANSPAGQRAVDVLVNSMRRVTESGRLDPTEPSLAAGQFLSGTHGYVLLQAGGVFGAGSEDSLPVIGALAINLMVGLGDDRERAGKSLGDALARRALRDADLGRFLDAQDADATYDRALAELRDGRKVSHWMWFVFPQIAGLGRSEMSRRYAIASLGEARAYAADPVLGARLRECARALLGHRERPAVEILGGIDAVKLRSSMTLFARAAPEEPLFREVLEAFYDGAPDPETERLIA